MSESDQGKELAAENERLREEVERLQGAGGGGWAKTRRWLTPIVGVLTVIVIVATTVGVWVNRTVWNQDKYMERVVPVAEQPAVIEAMATQLTDQTMVALDVQKRVSDALAQLSANTDLPEQITFLAGPLTESIRNLVHDQAVKFLSSDAFQTYWQQANAALHPKIVALLKGDYDQLPNVKVGEEVVQLDLVPIIAQVLRNLAQQGIEGLNLNVTIPELPSGDPRAAIEKLSVVLGTPLPADFGQVTIMSSAQLHSYQTAANALRAIGWILLFLTVILIALTLVLARNRRRAVMWLGLGTAAGVVVATVILRNITSSIIDSIQSQQAQDAARAVAQQFGSSLRGAGAMVGWTGLVVGIVAYLMGRPRWMMRIVGWVRRGPSGESGLGAWLVDNADAARIIVIALAVLILFLVGFGLFSVVIVGALLALALSYIGAGARAAAGSEAT